MKKYGVNYTNTTGLKPVDNKENEAVKAVLTKLNEGYKKRDPKLADEFLDLFVGDDSVYLLGTASDELCPGVAEVKDLLESDWEYWGDAAFDLDKVIIKVDGDVAWFAIPGTVKYSFEHNQERYDGYVAFAKEKANDETVPALERIAFVNWAMALTYHQQDLNPRDYFCPMRFSGVMIKDKEMWKIAQGQFSMPKGLFADQRLESDQEFVNELASEKENFAKFNKETMGEPVKTLLHEFAANCIGVTNPSLELVNNYFTADETTHVISPDTEWFVGQEAVVDFLKESNQSILQVDTESAITNTKDNKTWITLSGTVKQSIDKEELAQRALRAINEICDSEKASQEKLFNLHRQVAYVLKESAYGADYTCPVRISAVVSENGGMHKFEQMHISYPYYWIFEGKLDSLI
jgi:hypothetical protein